MLATRATIAKRLTGVGFPARDVDGAMKEGTPLIPVEVTYVTRLCRVVPDSGDITRIRIKGGPFPACARRVLRIHQSRPGH